MPTSEQRYRSVTLGAVDPPVRRDERQVAHHPVGDRVERDRGEDAGDDQALVERALDVAGRGAHREGADDRRDDRDAAEHERVERDGGLLVEGQDAEQHDGHRGDRVGLEEVGGHAGAVADVVADVVGDHGRVARIVLGDARLDLADEVGADVGGLGEDAAAESREDRDQRAAEAEADERVDGLLLGLVEERGEDPVVAGDAEQRQADDEHAGDGAAAEGDVERRADAARGPTRRRGSWPAPTRSCRCSRRRRRGRPPIRKPIATERSWMKSSATNRTTPTPAITVYWRLR